LGFGNNRYVLAGGIYHSSFDKIWTSLNGIDWTSVPFSEFVNPSTGIAYGDHGFVAVGGLWAISHHSIVSSPDGVEWELQPIDSKYFGGWVFGAGDYVFGRTFRHQPPLSPQFSEQGTDVWISKTGQEWRRATISAHESINWISFGDGVYIAVGSTGSIFASLDGFSWEAIDSGASNTLNAVTHGDGMFVAVGALGAILTSADGKSWASQNSNTTRDLTQVSWNHGFVVAERPGFQLPDGWTESGVLTSSNAVDWSVHRPNGGLWLQSVIPWRDGFAGIVENQGAVSDDGIAWTKTGPVSTYYASEICSVDGLLAYVPSDSSPMMTWSADGTNWLCSQLPWATTPNQQSAITTLASAHGTLLIRSRAENLIQSEPVIPRAPSLNELPFIISGGPGRDAVIQINVSGSSPFSYQWKRDGIDIAGETTRWLTLTSDEPPGHLYSVEVTNQIGAVTSDATQVMEPDAPNLSINYDGLIGVNVRGNTGRRYVLEISDHLSTDSIPAIWRKASEFRIETGDEARVLPSLLGSPINLFFRARVTE